MSELLDIKDCVNSHCPWSGDPVSADSLTMYRGKVVGFCNPGCRDDFAANVEERPSDRQYFDILIKEQDLDATS